jgi:hypothetical protein
MELPNCRWNASNLSMKPVPTSHDALVRPRGARVPDAVPKNYGDNLTILGSLSSTGLEAVITINGPTHTAVFRAYVSHVLAPTLMPGDIVIMDNLGAHKVKGIRETIAAAGA